MSTTTRIKAIDQSSVKKARDNRILRCKKQWTKNRIVTSESPSPSCPAAINKFDNPGTGPSTGFPPGTGTINDNIVDHQVRT